MIHKKIFSSDETQSDPEVRLVLAIINMALHYKSGSFPLSIELSKLQAQLNDDEILSTILYLQNGIRDSSSAALLRKRLFASQIPMESKSLAPIMPTIFV